MWSSFSALAFRTNLESSTDLDRDFVSCAVSLVVMALALTGVTTSKVMARHPTIVTIISFSGEEEYGNWVDFDCFLNVLLPSLLVSILD